MDDIKADITTISTLLVHVDINSLRLSVIDSACIILQVSKNIILIRPKSNSSQEGDSQICFPVRLIDCKVQNSNTNYSQLKIVREEANILTILLKTWR